MTPWPYPLWIAHRGAGTLAPENTLAAFALGAACGFSAFECDVRVSRDGVPYLLHDDALERTTSGHGPARALDWPALQRLDAGAWHSAAHAGQRLPSLQALAGWLRPRGLAVNLEIKPDPGTDEATGAAVALAARALWAGAEQGHAPPPLLSSFRPAALRAAQAAAPELPRALLLDRLRPGWLDEARALGCVAVVARHRLVDAALVARLHGAGMRALCYTVNDAAQAQRLAEAGVDGLITDAVDRLGPGDAARRRGGAG